VSGGATYGGQTVLAACPPRWGVVTAVALALLAGCSPGGELSQESARKGGTLTVTLPDPPDSLDPAVADSPVALRALWLTHTAPLSFAHAPGAAGSELVPGLARELPEVSDEGRRITFRLRRGLRYSDGRALRTADFERAVKRALVLNPRGLELLGSIAGARRYARDPQVGVDIEGIETRRFGGKVRITLTAPDPTILMALALPMSAPVPAGYATTDRSRHPPPGIGSYRLGRAREGRDFTLVRERSFGLPGIPAGNADEIVGKVVDDRRRAATATIDGFVDASEGDPPLDLLPSIRSKYKDRYDEQQTLALDFLRLDASRPPFDDRDARRAVGFAIDEAALSRVRDGLLEPTCNLIVPSVPGYRELDPCPYGDREGDSDLVKARQLLGESAAVAAPVLVAVEEVPHGKALERDVVATLRKIGLRARVARTPAQRRRARISLGRRLPSVPHPVRYLRAVDDPLLNGRVTLLALEGEPQDHADAWATVDRETVESARVLPYGVETVGVLLSERLDATNCRRFSPVYGLDWSSLCLR